MKYDIFFINTVYTYIYLNDIVLRIRSLTLKLKVKLNHLRKEILGTPLMSIVYW